MELKVPFHRCIIIQNSNKRESCVNVYKVLCLLTTNGRKVKPIFDWKQGSR